jgi:hypothetical protein
MVKYISMELRVVLLTERALLSQSLKPIRKRKRNRSKHSKRSFLATLKDRRMVMWLRRMSNYPINILPKATSLSQRVRNGTSMSRSKIRPAHVLLLSLLILIIEKDNVVTYNALEKMEEIAGAKGLKPHHIEETKRKYAYQKNPVKICRMLGLLLRHNVDVYTIVKGFDELDGATPGTFVFRMKKFLAQFVKNINEPQICPDCKEKALVFAEGCFTCTQCGHSKCS